MSAASARDHACQVAGSDPERALGLAEQILDPWYASQALAHVVAHIADERVTVAMTNTVKRAAECSDDYRRAAVLAWLIAALHRRQRRGDALRVLGKALHFAAKAEPVGSRAEALGLLYQATLPLDHSEAGKILHQLVDLANAAPHWRCRRAVVACLAMHAAAAPAKAESEQNRLRDPKLAVRMARAISLGWVQPRGFV